MYEKIKTLLYIGGFFFLIVSSIEIYNLGYSSGSNSVIVEYQNQLLKVKEEAKKKELEYAKENSRLKDEVLLAKRDYKSKLAVLSNSFNNQLQKSNSRAEYYRKQATNPDRCRNLATHTARLDRVVTEGISLVRLLSEHIKFRDEQLRQVGKQLQQEREFIK